MILDIALLVAGVLIVAAIGCLSVWSTKRQYARHNDELERIYAEHTARQERIYAEHAARQRKIYAEHYNRRSA